MNQEQKILGTSKLNESDPNVSQQDMFNDSIDAHDKLL